MCAIPNTEYHLPSTPADRTKGRYYRLLDYISNFVMGYQNSTYFFRSSVLYIFRVHRHVRDARIHRTYRPRNPIREMQCRNSLPSSGAAMAPLRVALPARVARGLR